MVIFALKSGGIGLLSGIVIGFISKKISKIMVFMIAASYLFLFKLQFIMDIYSFDWLSWKDTAVEMAKQTKYSNHFN